MKPFFLNILSGLKKFFLSRGFKKFISREFLILLLGATIVGGASLYQDYEEDSIRNYNAALNFEINKEIDSITSLAIPYKNEYETYGYTSVFEDLNETNIRNRVKEAIIDKKDYPALNKNKPWLYNPVEKETYESFSRKFIEDETVSYYGISSKKYSMQVYNAMELLISPKFKASISYENFVKKVKSDNYWTAMNYNLQIDKENIKIRDEVSKLESERLPEKLSTLSPYFVEDVTFYVLIILYGLRLLLHLIISSIRVLRKV